MQNEKKERAKREMKPRPKVQPPVLSFPFAFTAIPASTEERPDPSFHFFVSGNEVCLYILQGKNLCKKKLNKTK
jgi:hypothetical protein